jgi:hypothetical protein
MNCKILGFAQHMMMSGRILFSRKRMSVTAAALLIGVPGLALVVRARASDDWHEVRGVVGTWRLQLTPVYCPGITTGTLPAPFQGLATFTSDGTLTNTFANSLFGYDTPGHGSWWKTEDGRYKDVFELLIVDPPAASPYVPGTQKGFADITLDDEDHFTAQVMAEYFSASGAVYLTKCLDVTATRLNDNPNEP